jgi:hypothetical protein
MKRGREETKALEAVNPVPPETLLETNIASGCGDVDGLLSACKVKQLGDRNKNRNSVAALRDEGHVPTSHERAPTSPECASTASPVRAPASHARALTSPTSLAIDDDDDGANTERISSEFLYTFHKNEEFKGSKPACWENGWAQTPHVKRQVDQAFEDLRARHCLETGDHGGDVPPLRPGESWAGESWTKWILMVQAIIN